MGEDHDRKTGRVRVREPGTPSPPPRQRDHGHPAPLVQTLPIERKCRVSGRRSKHENRSRRDGSTRAKQGVQSLVFIFFSLPFSVPHRLRLRPSHHAKAKTARSPPTARSSRDWAMARIQRVLSGGDWKGGQEASAKESNQRSQASRFAQRERDTPAG